LTLRTGADAWRAGGRGSRKKKKKKREKNGDMQLASARLSIHPSRRDRIEGRKERRKKKGKKEGAFDRL